MPQVYENNINDVVNRARRLAGKERIDNAMEDMSDEGKDSRLVFETSFKSLLSAGPWNFATKRKRLERVSETPIDSYTFSFLLPTDGLFLWDLYNTGAGRINEISYFLGTQYSYVAFPLNSGLKFLDNTAEIIGNRIASNYSELSVLYTVDQKFPLTTCSQPFIDTLVLNMEEAFFKIKNTDEQDLQYRIGSNEKIRKKRNAQTSKENRKAYSKQDSEIISRLNQCFF